MMVDHLEENKNTRRQQLKAKISLKNYTAKTSTSESNTIQAETHPL